MKNIWHNYGFLLLSLWLSVSQMVLQLCYRPLSLLGYKCMILSQVLISVADLQIQGHTRYFQLCVPQEPPISSYAKNKYRKLCFHMLHEFYAFLMLRATVLERKQKSNSTSLLIYNRPSLEFLETWTLFCLGWAPIYINYLI